MNLIYLCIFFFIISWFYANALKTMFKHSFKWHYASVVGIALVVTTTAWFVWRFQEPLTFEYAWSTLALVFTCALPGMAYHGENYLERAIKDRKDLQAIRTKVIELNTKNMLLERERNQLENEREFLKNRVLPVLDRIEKGQNNEAKNLAELAGIVNMYLWAKSELENRN